MPARTYDVTFSFLSQDLPIAQRLTDALNPLSTFVYSQRQTEIVTRDGMETFSSVFGRDSILNGVQAHVKMWGVRLEYEGFDVDNNTANVASLSVFLNF